MLKIVPIEKNWRSKNFDFSSLKPCSPDQFFGLVPTRTDIEFSNFVRSEVKSAWGNILLYSIYVLFSRYFTWNRIAPLFSCGKMLLNRNHDRKWISKFPQIVLQSFLITARGFLSHFKNSIDYWIWSSKMKLANLWQIFLGQTS